MEKQVKVFPVMVADLNLSKSTKEITGLETFNQLMAERNTLFANNTDEELTVLLLDKLYKGKLKGIRKNQITTMTQEEKRKHALEILSINVALTQDRESTRDDNNRSKAMNLFMNKRVTISGNLSTKYAYHTAAFGNVLDYQLVIGTNFSELMEKMSTFVYIQRVRTFEPELDDKKANVRTEPMRAGSGGDVLRKLYVANPGEAAVPRLVFLRSELIIESEAKITEFPDMYSTLYNEESQNEEDYRFNDEDKKFTIDANDVPALLRNAEGMFAEDFQNWLNSEYNAGAGLQTQITNALAAGNDY